MVNKYHKINELPRQTRALTIAGLDPTGGAGATADLEVMAAHGVSGTTALTALTVQSIQGVRRVAPVEPGLLSETLKCLREDVPVAGVKIGMLATAKNVEVVVEWLRKSGIPPDHVVLDPVIRASSGAELLEAEGVRRLRDDLLSQVGWVTPNLEELAALLGGRPSDQADVQALDRGGIPAMARELALRAPGINVVVTGGHLEPPDDFLLEAGGRETWFPGRRVEAGGIHGTHGTGCVFSTALLCQLLQGAGPKEAVRGAKEWVVRRLRGH